MQGVVHAGKGSAMRSVERDETQFGCVPVPCGVGESALVMVGRSIMSTRADRWGAQLIPASELKALCAR
jgi:hypothetical protein